MSTAVLMIIYVYSIPTETGEYYVLLGYFVFSKLADAWNELIMTTGNIRIVSYRK